MLPWIKFAKHVLGLAAQGIGYHVMEQPDKGSAWVVVAFRRPSAGPIPHHLTPITKPGLIRMLEDKFIPRGNTEPPKPTAPLPSTGMFPSMP